MNINNTGVGSSLLDVSSYAQNKRPEKISVEQQITKEDKSVRINEGLDISKVHVKDFGKANVQYIDTSNPTETVDYDHPNALDKKIYTALKASSDTSNAIHTSSFQLTDVIESIESTRPDLLDKDWGFTINEKDEIEILRGSSLLSEEIGFLEEKLAILNENQELTKLADAIVADSKADADIGASKLGLYDITRNNISKLDLRDVLTDRKFTHETGRLQHQADINLKDDLRTFDKKETISIDVRV